MVNWDDLRLLLEVDRTGSFFRTGDALGMAPSTVSRRIAALETTLGQRLVERASDGCRLTPRGRILVDLARDTARGLDRFSQSAGTELTGEITVTTGDGFLPLVMEVSAGFLADHPRCRVDTLVEQDFLRLGRGEADVAIRTQHLGEPALIYRRLGAIRYGFYRSPTLVPLPDGSWPVVQILPPMDRSPQMQTLTNAGLGPVVWRGSSFAGILAAVRAGIGVSVLPVPVSTGLSLLDAPVRVPNGEAFLVTRASARHDPHITEFVRRLTEAASTHLSY